MLKEKTRSSAFGRHKSIGVVICLLAAIFLPNIAYASNYALQFDGADDFVSIADTYGDFDFDYTFTVEAWVKPLSLAGSENFKAIVRGAHGEPPPVSTGGWVMSLNKSDYSDWALSVCLPLCDAAHSGTGNLQVDQWQHLAATYDGTNITIYRNAVPVASKIHEYSGNVTNIDFVLLGIWETSFNGLIDEAHIWNIARTQADIQNDMYKTLSGTEPGLVGYWSFDEGMGQTVFDSTSNQNDGRLGSSDGVDSADPTWVVSDAPRLVAYYPFNGNANDESGNGNDGTVYGATLTADRFGNLDSAYSFDGIDDYVEVPDSASFNFNQPITLSAWINLDDNSKGGIVGQWGWGGLAGDAFILYVKDSKLRATLPIAGLYHLDSVTNLSLNDWIFVSMVFDGNLLQLFINGILDNSVDLSSLSPPIIIPQVDSDQPVKIGLEDIYFPSQNYFKGILDDIRIYNSALSRNEIRQLYLDEAARFTVSGLVRYSETPLGNVKVELRSGPPDYEVVDQTTFSNELGEYSFLNVVDGDYQVRAYGPTNEYVTWVGYGVTVTGQDVVEYFQLAKNIILLTPEYGSTVTTLTPTLSWEENSDADRYVCQINITDGWILVHFATNLDAAVVPPYTLPENLTDGQLTDGVTYTWQIGAYDSFGNWIGSTMNAFQFTVSLDSDNDGMPDLWEGDHGLNPNDPSDADGDPDGDGLLNFDEYNNGTDPLNPDSDGDWVNDGDEVANATDPNNPLSFTPPGTGAIRGTIYQSNGITPITVVQLEVQAHQGNPCGWRQHIASGWTNLADGTYTIVGLPPGDYYLKINNMNQSNYVNEWWTGDTDPSDYDCSLAQSVTVSSGGAETADFELDLGGSIEGTIYESDGITPVTGVHINVEAIQGDPCGWHQWMGGAWTNPGDGTYTIAGLPLGTYYLRTDNLGENYVNEWWASGGSTSDCGGGEPVGISSPGQAVMGKDFQLDLGGSISGTVYEADGSTPIANLHVRAFSDACSWSQLGGTNTDEFGEYTIYGLPEGNVYVNTCASCNGYNYLDEWYDDETDCNQAAGVTVIVDQTTGGIDFELEPGATISGTVYESNGTTAVTGVEIQVQVIQGDPCGGWWNVRSSNTDSSDGRYTITGLPPGDYYLRTNNMNQSNYVNEWWASGGSSYDCGDAEQVTVVSDVDTPGVNFQLDLGGSISGTVYESDGTTPVTGVQIDVQAHQGNPCGWREHIASGWTNSTDGTYTVMGLPPGDYYLRTNNMNQSNYVNEWWTGDTDPSSYDCSLAQSVTVSSGATETGKDFQLDLGGTISGTVFDELTGEPVEDATCGSIDLGVGWHKFVYRQAEVDGSQASRAAFKAPGDTDWRWFSTSHLNIRTSPDDGAESGIILINKRNTSEYQYPGNHGEMVQCVDIDATEETGWYGESVVSIVRHDQNIHGDDDNYTSYYEGYFKVDTAGTWLFSTDSDDASEIVIDDQVVAHWYHGHGPAHRWEHKYDVRLHRYETGEHVETTTGNPDGSYMFVGLLSGNYIVEATAPGYVNEFFEEGRSWGGAAAVIVNAPESTENINFTLPPDTDEDGMPDDWETDYGLNPTDASDAGVDLDGDGLGNMSEYQNNTDPNNADTDGDKMSDGYEVNAGTDPTNPSDVPALPIVGSVMNVRESDGSFNTHLDITIEDGFTGTLPDDIATITVTGPSGVVASYPADDFTYYPEWRNFFIAIPGSPELGEYTFTVTVVSSSLTGTATDFQSINRTLPIPDTGTFSPTQGETLTSKTPSFSWGPVDYPEVPISYVLWIEDPSKDPPEPYGFLGFWQQGMLFYTVPDGTLEPGHTYRWQVWAVDSSDWVNIQNRSNSDWLTFTTAGTLTHSATPAIDLDQWGAVTCSTTTYGTDLYCWVKVIDHDGVSSDGSSHAVEVTFPNAETYQMYFFGLESPESAISAGYDVYVDLKGSPPDESGDYTFTVTDPDGKVNTAADTLVVDPLEPPDPDSFTPSLKNPVNESITAFFDNVYVNGELCDDFDAYGSIGDLDLNKWQQPWCDRASIENQKLKFTLDNCIGNTGCPLDFVDPASINSIRADITVESISSDAAGAYIGGWFYNNGINDVWAEIKVRQGEVYYGVYELNSTGSVNILVETVLMTVSLGQKVTASISWDSTTLTFDVDGNTAPPYTPTGIIEPPNDSNKSAGVDIYIFAPYTTPTFTWDAVPGANRYSVNIHSNDNSQTIWHGYTGNQTSYTVPPGILSPITFYSYSIEAWDAHNPLNVDNISISPASWGDEHYRFLTGEESVDPFIDLDSTGVYTWSSALAGAYLSFWIKVHDAQGVPGNIKHVKVIHPSGAEEFLGYFGDNPFVPATPTSAIYYLGSILPPADGETYTFVVEDNDGHSYQITEELTVNTIGFPAVASLIPTQGTNIGSTAVMFSWDPVASFYAIDIFDYYFNRIYEFFTTSTSYEVPAGFLEENTLYRWQVTTRREFFDQNVDNMSSSPGSYLQSLTFTTTPPIDTDGDGMPDWWENAHGLNPGTDDSGLDPDADGLSNLDEYDNVSDPNNPDSDSDGLSDGDEVNTYFTNPNNSDSDRDGLTDGDEVALGTNPTNPDSDGDWVNDGADNCPALANPEQEDFDGDGRGDECDIDDDNDCYWDTQEGNSGTNPLDPASTPADHDGDCITDAEEMMMDTDGDLVNDIDDNCENTPNGPENESNQLDADNDDVGDVCDNCPDTPNINQLDTDSDNVGDVCDNAPNDWNSGQEDGDVGESGNPNPDGIPDVLDNCPDVYNPMVPYNLGDSMDDCALGNLVAAEDDLWQVDYDCDGMGDACDGDLSFKKGTSQEDPAPTDRDGDNVDDVDDNCPYDSNPKSNWTDITGANHNNEQPDYDLDGIGDVCDADDDNDGVLDGCDAHHPDNATAPDPDGDGIIDSCDSDDDDDLVLDGCDADNNPTATDRDGDNVIDSCDNCLEKPNKDQDDSDGNGVGDVCEPTTRIIFTLKDPDLPEVPDNNYSNWEPRDGRKAQIKAILIENGTEVSPQPTITLTLVDSLTSNEPGKYYNHSPSGPSASDYNNLPDYSDVTQATDPPNTITILSHDYGGKTVIRATTSYGSVDPADLRVPKDTDNDGLPDKYESDPVLNPNGTLNASLDDSDLDGTVDKDEDEEKSVNNLDPGDGIKAFGEYRGVMWNGTHYRLSAERKDLFVCAVDFTAHGVPFGIGDAFPDSGIDVLTIETTSKSDSFFDINKNYEEENIDVLIIRSYVSQVSAADKNNGHIRKLTGKVRTFEIPVLGESYFGNSTSFGQPTKIFSGSIKNYIGDRPYLDQETLTAGTVSSPTWGSENSMLDRLFITVGNKNIYQVEDVDDDGIKDGGEDDNHDGRLNGDKMETNVDTWKSTWPNYPNKLNPFDIDKDDYVELPQQKGDPAALAKDTKTEHEYNETDVFIHVETHEIGHAVGMGVGDFYYLDELGHCFDKNCAMYQYSINWKRASYFCPYHQGLIQIHNQ